MAASRSEKNLGGSGKGRIITIDDSTLNKLAVDYIFNPCELEDQDLTSYCYAIEKAFFYYLDKLVPNRRNLKACKFEEFTAIMVNHLPSLKSQISNIDEMLREFKIHQAQRTRCGAILLKDKSPYEFLLVEENFTIEVWDKKEKERKKLPIFSFPKGKQMRKESELKCARREVIEETGYDTKDCLKSTLFFEEEFGTHPYRHQVRLYILPNVPGDLEFKPKVQGEIKKTNWFQLMYIQGLKKKNQPPRHYDERSFKSVYPFLEKIKLWVDTEKRNGRKF